MTETLKDLMTERADAAAPPHVDLDAIVRAGDSRVRRRRVVLGAGMAAVAASVALGVPAVLHSNAPDQTRTLQPAAPDFAERRITYAVGSTIHYGDQVIDVSPGAVKTFVQTDDGFVFTDAYGAIFFTSGAEVEQIGDSGQPSARQLTADDSGSYVGWVDKSALPVSEFVVYDTSSRSEVVRTSEGNKPAQEQAGQSEVPMIEAIDGSYAYWHSSEGFTAWNLTSGTGRVLPIDVGYHWIWLQDVAAGQLAVLSDDGQQVVVSADPVATAPAFPAHHAWAANLSPNAERLYTRSYAEPDEMKVFDVQTGAEQTPNHPGYPFIALSQWLDDDRFVAMGAKNSDALGPTDQLDLLTCSISAGECTVAVSEAGLVGQLVTPLGGSLAY